MGFATLLVRQTLLILSTLTPNNALNAQQIAYRALTRQLARAAMARLNLSMENALSFAIQAIIATVAA